MAFPDNYTEWGGTAADFTTSAYTVADGVAVIRARANKVTVWDGPAADADQVTDLYNHDQAPVTELVSAASGLLESFWVPDTYTALWVSVEGADRVELIPPTGVPVEWANVLDKPATFPPAPHAHTSADITDLAAAVDARITGKVDIAHLPFVLAVDHGVVADGVTDNTTALAATVTALGTRGAIMLPAGVIIGQLVIDTDMTIIGAGVGGTILKAPAGLAEGVIKSKNYATLTGTAAQSPETRGSHRLGIHDLTIDGNKANAASSVGVQIYGAGWRFSNLRVQNCGSDGLQTEFGTDVNFTSFNSLEGNADNLMTCLNGRHGWRFRGPHDSNINNLVSHSNVGWGFRNESSVGFYNGTLGHCSKFNMFINANGWYVGEGVASYNGGQIAGNGGTGIEFLAGIGSVIMKDLLVAGWTTGVILRGVQHDVSFTLQRNVTGLQIDGLGFSRVQMVGQVVVANGGVVGVAVTSEVGPNQYYGIWTVDATAAMTSGAFQALSLVVFTQTGTAGSGVQWNIPSIFSLPSTTEVRTGRALTTTADLYAARNTASQIQIGATATFGGLPGINIANDMYIQREGAKRVAVPADHTIRGGRAVTASRPVAATVGAGAQFYDTTLSKPIWSDGAVWRDAAGTAV